MSRAGLSNLVLSDGVLTPAFASGTTTYTATVAGAADSLTVWPTVADNATVTVNGAAVLSGRPSAPLFLAVGGNTVTLVVTSLDGSATRTYTVTVTRPADPHPLNATWNASTDVPVTASRYTAAGNTVNLALNCVPTANELTVVRNTGCNFIQGQFSNLAQGQAVALSYAGQTYHFVANYYGGNGNDLVLVGKWTRVYAWGSNGSGQLGDGTTSDRSGPGPVTAVLGDEVLLGKTIVSVAAGDNHSLALCADGTVVAWGANTYGQLGDGTTTNHSVPVAVNMAAGSALYGKTVVAIAACGNYSLALCADGTVAAWG